ncbi:hypothetical protein [Trueperella sp. LYQ143]|uniref:hypothetical protein n=1 Tax=Trueperella sp. LYQ143 TaxID=3391059 RepID=UPI0039838F15
MTTLTPDLFQYDRQTAIDIIQRVLYELSAQIDHLLGAKDTFINDPKAYGYLYALLSILEPFTGFKTDHEKIREQADANGISVPYKRDWAQKIPLNNPHLPHDVCPLSNPLFHIDAHRIGSEALEKARWHAGLGEWRLWTGNLFTIALLAEYHEIDLRKEIIKIGQHCGKTSEEITDSMHLILKGVKSDRRGCCDGCVPESV